jgi:hypothetical protein
MPDLGPRGRWQRERDKPWELELRGRRLIVERYFWEVGEALWRRRIPAVEVGGQVVVEHPGADLEQQVGATGVQRICCFLTMRLLITWLTVDSTNAVEMASPARRRSP